MIYNYHNQLGTYHKNLEDDPNCLCAGDYWVAEGSAGGHQVYQPRDVHQACGKAYHTTFMFCIVV